MKNLTLTLSALVLLSSAAFAKKKKKVTTTDAVKTTAAVAAAAVDPHAGHNHAPAVEATPAPAVVPPQAQIAAPTAVVPPPVAPQVAKDPNEADKHMKFVVSDYDFKTLPEGPQATAEFKFKNIGNEVIELQNVQASCGCTVPEWTKEAIAPGKTATIKAVYNTQGRPGPFTKNLTVTTKQGYSKVITIKGIVEKAPATSVPTNDQNMMIKH